MVLAFARSSTVQESQERKDQTPVSIHCSVVYGIQFTMQWQCDRQAVADCQRKCNVTKGTDYTPPRQTLQMHCKSSYL